MGEVKIVGFCDVLTERAEKAAKEYGAKGASVYTDYKKLLEDQSIDAVHVCTPKNPDKNEGYITFNSTKYGQRIESTTTQASGISYFEGQEFDMGYLEAK